MNISKKNKKAFGTNEWSTSTANFIKGCANNCKYCYAKAMAVHYGRCKPDDWVEEKINFIKMKVVPNKRDGKIMFPSTHDITQSNVDYAIKFIDNLLHNGNQLLIVTKPDPVVIKQLCEEFKNQKHQILFRFSIGSADDETLKFWEPNAPSFEKRMQALKYAFEAGFDTSISAEPLLDINPEGIIDACLSYVTDAIWLGKPNKLIQRLKINGVADKCTLEAAQMLKTRQNDKWVLSVYGKYNKNKQIKWKSSFKKVIGIEVPKVRGLDI